MQDGAKPDPRDSRLRARTRLTPSLVCAAQRPEHQSGHYGHRWYRPANGILQPATAFHMRLRSVSARHMSRPVFPAPTWLMGSVLAQLNASIGPNRRVEPRRGAGALPALGIPPAQDAGCALKCGIFRRSSVRRQRTACRTPNRKALYPVLPAIRTAIAAICQENAREHLPLGPSGPRLSDVLELGTGRAINPDVAENPRGVTGTT